MPSKEEGGKGDKGEGGVYGGDGVDEAGETLCEGI